MQNQAKPPLDDQSAGNANSSNRRANSRDLALQTALRKRRSGAPAYTVPEAAALMSVSPEYLYRLARAGAFPAVRISLGPGTGRFVVPAKAIDRLLDHATSAGTCTDAAEWSAEWSAGRVGGAA